MHVLIIESWSMLRAEAMGAVTWSIGKHVTGMYGVDDLTKAVGLFLNGAPFDLVICAETLTEDEIDGETGNGLRLMTDLRSTLGAPKIIILAGTDAPQRAGFTNVKRRTTETDAGATSKDLMELLRSIYP